jgi:hypothetical protein
MQERKTSFFKSSMAVLIFIIAAAILLYLFGFFDAPKIEDNASTHATEPYELASLLPAYSDEQLSGLISNASFGQGQFSLQMDDEIASDTALMLTG